MAGKPWYGRDTQLTLRMGFTLFLLVLLYTVFLGVLWRVTGSAVLLVLASTHFDEADYIRDYDAFKVYAHARAGGVN